MYSSRALVALLVVFLAALAASELHHIQRGREVLLLRESINTRTARQFHEDSEHIKRVSKHSDETKHQYLVHVQPPMTKERLDEIEKHIGERLRNYIPHHNFILWATEETAMRARSAPYVHWVGSFHSRYRIAPDFEELNEVNEIVALLPAAAGPHVPREHRRALRRSVTEVQDIAARWTTSAINQLLHGATFHAVSEKHIIARFPHPVSGSQALRVAQWIAAQPETHWVEPRHPYMNHNRYAQYIVQSGTPGSTPLTTQGLDGTGEIIGLGDTGIDYDHCFFAEADGSAPPTNGTLIASRRKIVAYRIFPNIGDDSDVTGGHGTHMAGTIAGVPLSGSDPSAPFSGVAPQAKIYFTDLSTGDTPNPPSDLESYFDIPYSQGINIFVSGFGAAVSYYNTMAESIDDFTFSGAPEFLPIFPAGNNGSTTFGLSTLVDTALSKNALVVGATLSSNQGCQFAPPDGATSSQITNNPNLFNNNVVATFSSRGPTPDGRNKPDVVSVGNQVTSARSDGNLNSDQCGTSALMAQAGTSQAAAAAAGAMALAHQYFAEGYFPEGSPGGVLFSNPASSLLKALAVQSSSPASLVDVTGDGGYQALARATTSGTSGPDPFQGYGQIQLDNTLYFGNAASPNLRLSVNQGISLQEGGSYLTCFDVGANPTFLRATVSWTDPAGSPASGLILINNIDAVLVHAATGATYRSNGLIQYDAVNNVEQITLLNPPGGTYSLVIYGTSVAGTQQVSFAVNGDSNLSSLPCDPTTACPNGCSLSGTCSGGKCTCDSGRTGPDCSITTCPNDCSQNGICDAYTSSCSCASGWAGDDCSLTVEEAAEQERTVVVKKEDNSSSGIDEAVFGGVVAAVFVVALVLGGVIGMFIAVKYLEKKRDALIKKRNAAAGGGGGSHF